MAHSTFESVELAPRDPILGITEAFNADTRATKVNLGVGVYTDENGKIPLLKAVREAEMARINAASPRGYLPIDGIVSYNKEAQGLVFGRDSKLIADGRVCTVQALGGTGALKIGADFLKRTYPNSEVWISDPSWENHRALFEGAGFTVKNYPYYDAALRGVNFEAMKAAIAKLAPHTIVVLHACCHNPTGADLTEAQWGELARILVERELVPFLDMAYQGFSKGIEEDAFAVRLIAATGIDLLASSSFSKSFSLYGERVGALSIVTKSKEETARVLSQLKRTVRTTYSNPPTHGATLVTSVLGDPKLRQLWEEELAGMRGRIQAMREGLAQQLAKFAPGQDFAFITRQNGMFSYSGLTAPQVERLASEFGIYAVSTGRICVAALNNSNLSYVAKAIGTVVAPTKQAAPAL
jgi:aromatic-amino-acid transaminase